MSRILRRYRRKNAKKIEEYIQNQLREVLEYAQMTLKEYIDPFDESLDSRAGNKPL